MRPLKSLHRAALGRLSGLVAVAAVALLAVGCGGGGGWKAPLVPPPGLLFTQYSAPLDLAFHKDGEPTHTTNLRRGDSKAQYIQLFYRPLSVTWGDASVEEAARNAGIQNLEYTDYSVMSILGLYVEFTTHAYGQ